MRYNLAIKSEIEDAYARLARLIMQGVIVEIKKVSPKRSLNQNNYFHLLLGAFGLETGFTIEEAKTIAKRTVAPELFLYEKNGQKFLKSSADLTKEDLSIAIDKFIQYAGHNGIELPLATDTEAIKRLENYIEQNRKYL